MIRYRSNERKRTLLIFDVQDQLVKLFWECVMLFVKAFGSKEGLDLIRLQIECKMEAHRSPLSTDELEAKLL